MTTTLEAPPLATTYLLLAALRPDVEAGVWREACERVGLSWDDLAVRAIVLGLAPQLHHRLQSWQISPSSSALAKLAATRRAHAQRNEAIFAQLDEILAACATENIHPIVLKGVHLASGVYAEPALRPMNDIDLLFEASEIPRVDAIFRRLGYESQYKSPQLGAGVTKHTSTYRRPGPDGATPNPYLSTSGDRTVEPHSSLQESWYGLRVDITPGLRQRAKTVTICRQPASVLVDEDLLLHLSVHFTFHLIMGAPALVQLCDLLAVCRRIDVDWDVFVQRAGGAGAAPYALAALFLAQRLLHAPVPTEALAALGSDTPRGLRTFIMRLDLDAIMRRTQQEPWSNTPQRLLHGLRARAETARWAPDFATRLRVWGTALQVMRSDTGRQLVQSFSK